jgi:hypothetical protein
MTDEQIKDWKNCVEVAKVRSPNAWVAVDAGTVLKPLSDAEIDKVWMLNGGGIAANRYIDFARAIEAAATAPLLERIADLERKSDQDEATMLWQAGEISKHLDRIAELERQLEQAREALSLALSDVEWRANSPTQKVIFKAHAAIQSKEKP